MEFAKRMDLFGEGIFSKLSEVRRRKVSAGEAVIDMSIGAPNIPPAAHTGRLSAGPLRRRRTIFTPSTTRPPFWTRWPPGMTGATE